MEYWSAGYEAYLRSQLFKLPADVPYDERWFEVACGVHSLGWGENGFQMFDEWSKTAPNRYDSDAARTLWENLNRRAARELERRITWATIAMKAEEAGWTADEG